MKKKTDKVKYLYTQPSPLTGTRIKYGQLGGKISKKDKHKYVYPKDLIKEDVIIKLKAKQLPTGKVFFNAGELAEFVELNNVYVKQKKK